MPPASKKTTTTKITPTKTVSSLSTPTTSTGAKNARRKLPLKTKKAPTHADIEEGRQIFSRMSDEDVKNLLENLEARCPAFEEKTAAARFGVINWSQIAPDGFSPEEACQTWSFIKSCERGNRNMHELVLAAQHKFNLKSNAIRQKAILNAPDFPTKPAGLSSAFSFYIHNKYAKMTERDKGTNFNYMLWYRDEGLVYGALSQEEKDGHIRFFEKEKANYEKRLAEYYEKVGINVENNPTGLPGLKETKPKASRVRTKPNVFEDAPQLPLTPLKSFIQTKFDRLESPPEDENERKEMEEKYTRKYNELGKSKKVKWIKYVLDEVEEYFNKIAEYKATHPQYNPKPFKLTNLLTSDEIALWEAKKGKPQKPSTSSVDYFRRELESEGQIDTNLSEQWKQLDFQDKKAYKLKHDLENVQYSKDLEQYYSSLPEFLRPILLPAMHKKMTKDSQGSKSVSKTKTVNGEHNNIINTPSSSAQKSKVKQKTPEKKQQQIYSDEAEQEDEVQEEEVVVKKSKKKRKFDVYHNIRDYVVSQEDDVTTMDDEEPTESPKKKKKKNRK